MYLRLPGRRAAIAAGVGVAGSKAIAGAVDAAEWVRSRRHGRTGVQCCVRRTRLLLDAGRRCGRQVRRASGLWGASTRADWCAVCGRDMRTQRGATEPTCLRHLCDAWPHAALTWQGVSPAPQGWYKLRGACTVQAFLLWVGHSEQMLCSSFSCMSTGQARPPLSMPSTPRHAVPPINQRRSAGSHGML